MARLQPLAKSRCTERAHRQPSRDISRTAVSPVLLRLQPLPRGCSRPTRPRAGGGKRVTIHCDANHKCSPDACDIIRMSRSPDQALSGPLRLAMRLTRGARRNRMEGSMMNWIFAALAFIGFVLAVPFSKVDTGTGRRRLAS